MMQVLYLGAAQDRMPPATLPGVTARSAVAGSAVQAGSPDLDVVVVCEYECRLRTLRGMRPLCECLRSQRVVCIASSCAHPAPRAARVGPAWLDAYLVLLACRTPNGPAVGQRQL